MSGAREPDGRVNVAARELLHGDVVPCADGSDAYVDSVTAIPGGGGVLVLLWHPTFRRDETSQMCLPGDQLVTIRERVGELVPVAQRYPDCAHRWRMVEGGYERYWVARIDPEDGRVFAYDDGVSDDGDGLLRMTCRVCGERHDVEAGEIVWE